MVLLVSEVDPMLFWCGNIANDFGVSGYLGGRGLVNSVRYATSADSWSLAAVAGLRWTSPAWWIITCVKTLVHWLWVVWYYLRYSIQTGGQFTIKIFTKLLKDNKIKSVWIVWAGSSWIVCWAINNVFVEKFWGIIISPSFNWPNQGKPAPFFYGSLQNIYSFWRNDV